MRHHLTAFAITAILAASPAFAQTTPATPGGTGAAGTSAATAPTGPAPGQMQAKRLMDRNVYSSDGVEIGEVEDLLLDPQGRVVAAIIEVEKQLNFPQKHVAVPYDQLRHDNAQRRVNLPMTRDQVRAMPAYNHQN